MFAARPLHPRKRTPRDVAEVPEDDIPGKIIGQNPPERGVTSCVGNALHATVPNLVAERL